MQFAKKKARLCTFLFHLAFVAWKLQKGGTAKQKYTGMSNHSAVYGNEVRICAAILAGAMWRPKLLPAWWETIDTVSGGKKLTSAISRSNMLQFFQRSLLSLDQSFSNSGSGTSQAY